MRLIVGRLEFLDNPKHYYLLKDLPFDEYRQRIFRIEWG
jgi:hypothetical protein